MAHELLWSCGCHEVDGQLVRECTQAAPHGDQPSNSLAKPYSRKCFRKQPVVAAQDDTAETATAQ